MVYFINKFYLKLVINTRFEIFLLVLSKIKRKNWRQIILKEMLLHKFVIDSRLKNFSNF